MAEKTYEQGVQEGQNRTLYLLLAIGDEYAAYDNWHPDKAHFLFDVRREIVQRLRLNAPYYPSLGGEWPREYPNFEEYVFTSG